MAPYAPNAAHDVQTLEGFLVVHVDCSDVLLEIPVPTLERSILLYPEFTALSTGGSEYAPGSAINSMTPVDGRRSAIRSGRAFPKNIAP